jgi:precorrin-6B C5,15-methyltransferase / cobalt-precorrin-6B C5,C15-methyltransferase
MRTHPSCQATAIESRTDRIGLIARNAIALGVPRLGMIEGEATDVLSGLDAPDAIFIGGGASTPGLLELCWEALPPRGRLVGNAVTLEGEAALAAFRADHGGDLARISVSRAEPVGPFTGWKPLMTVTQFAAVKS